MYIKVKATAGVKKENITEKTKTSFEICVKEPAERNLANKKIIELIARHFRVRSNRVRMIIGHHSASKILSVDSEV